MKRQQIRRRPRTDGYVNCDLEAGRFVRLQCQENSARMILFGLYLQLLSQGIASFFGLQQKGSFLHHQGVVVPAAGSETASVAGEGACKLTVGGLEG